MLCATFAAIGRMYATHAVWSVNDGIDKLNDSRNLSINVVYFQYVFRVERARVYVCVCVCVCEAS